jgi:ESCRT-II complex subunit VPS25
LKPTQLADIIGILARKNLAVHEPPKQLRAVLLYWRLPEEWAEVLHEWVRAPLHSSHVTLGLPLLAHAYPLSVVVVVLQATKTGQLNTILTFYEISNPPVSSALSGIPESLLRSAIAILVKGGRAQLISISDGDGVRFFPRTSK